MFEFFDQIVGFFEYLWSMVINLITMMFTTIQLLVEAQTMFPSIYAYFPTIFTTGFTIVAALAFIKFILAR